MSRVHYRYRQLAADHLRALMPGQTIPGERVEETARLLQDLARSLPKAPPRRKRKPKPHVEEAVYLNITYSRLSDGTGELYVDTAAVDLTDGTTWQAPVAALEEILADVIQVLREREQERPEIDNEE